MEKVQHDTQSFMAHTNNRKERIFLNTKIQFLEAAKEFLSTLLNGPKSTTQPPATAESKPSTSRPQTDQTTKGIPKTTEATVTTLATTAITTQLF